MNGKKIQFDSLDKKILNILQKNAKTPFLEIARSCGVSGAAIHQRVQKLEEAGFITGSRYIVNPKALGYHTCAFIGVQINLTSSKTHNEVFEKISQAKEIIDCHHITGKYSLLLKVLARDNEHLKKIIVEKIQSILEVTSTETFISLEEGFSRQLPIE